MTQTVCQFDSLVYEQSIKIINLSNLHEMCIIIIVNLRGNNTIIVKLNTDIKNQHFKDI